MTHTPALQRSHTLPGLSPEDQTPEDETEKGMHAAPSPIYNAQVLERIDRHAEATERLADSVRVGLSPLRELPNVLRDVAHNAACASVQVVETQLAHVRENVVENTRRLDSHGGMIAAINVAMSEVKTTMHNVGVFVGFCFLAGGVLVSVTVYIVMTRGH